MIGALANKVFGSSNDRLVKKYIKSIKPINDLSTLYESLSNEDLKGKTSQFKDRLAHGETLDQILPEAFATVREASRRVLNQYPYDVQLIGGKVLHEGKIAEMRTGEGKTLVSTLPVYLNALTGKGVHVVTVNDYLAERDSKWMGAIHEFLGMSVSCILHDMDDNQRRKAYEADITYATNHELGFDYLRDNMKFRKEERVLRDLHYALIDEVDSILVDEARTPLIISGPSDESSELYATVNTIMPKITPEDFEKDEKRKGVVLTEKGTEHIEKLLKEAGLLSEGNLYDVQNVQLVHHVNQALKAHTMFNLDTDYIVQDGEIKLIDEFTGRVMEGRRFSDGLHQALEAKENVTIQVENQTLASITYQNFFRLYDKLAGMTGTAATEAAEFEEIYKLQTVVIPTNRQIARIDHDDEIYRTLTEKNSAIVKLIQECQQRKQPVLVGTTSIEKSEELSSILAKNKISHQVLNARFHQQEANIIAEAGSPGAVTIATNMAGRGTDIKLGGNLDRRLEKALNDLEEAEKESVKKTIIDQHAQDEQTVHKAGGLYVIGTERHESRRIDNQLRGRSGRQGDPGSSKFFLSLEDDLMRIFGSEKLDAMLQRLGLKEGEAITHPWISKALEKAQMRVEARNFDIRKHLLKYDNVMNDQRKAIYGQRLEIMQDEDISQTIKDVMETTIHAMVERNVPPGTYADNWDIAGLKEEIKAVLGLDLPVEGWAKEEGIADEEIVSRLEKALKSLLEEKEKNYGEKVMRMAEKTLFLRILDHIWKEHLLSMDHLREGINLRAYGQRDPLNEYKHEAFNLFENMLDRLRTDITSALCHLDLQAPTEESVTLREDEGSADNYQLLGGGMEASQIRQKTDDGSDSKAWGRVRRNEPCPCGSGKKFKHCHGSVV